MVQQQGKLEFFVLQQHEETNSKCLYYILLSRHLVNQAHECATGTAQKTVSLSGLRRFSVPKIPKEEQEIIVTKLDEIQTKTHRPQRTQTIHPAKSIHRQTHRRIHTPSLTT
jgi:restriction endonuclease S subunit